MARWLALSVFVLATLAPALPSRGQDDPGAPRVRVVRPPEGSLRRGALAVPAWVAYAGGALVVSVAGGALALRARRRRPG